MQNKNESISQNITDGRFITAEEFKNMDLSPSFKFSNVKQWQKNSKEAEEENNQKIIEEIKKLEVKIDKIINILEKY